MTPRAECLRRAEALTMGERLDAYGPPAESFARVAAMWSAVLGVPVTAQQVCICMALVKIGRITATPDHRDSHDDAAAYVALAWECVEVPP